MGLTRPSWTTLLSLLILAPSSCTLVSMSGRRTLSLGPCARGLLAFYTDVVLSCVCICLESLGQTGGKIYMIHHFNVYQVMSLIIQNVLTNQGSIPGVGEPFKQ